MKATQWISAAALSAAALLSASAIAAPQTGVWFIQGGQNAYGGNTINIDTQGDRVFVMFAAGQVPSNTFFIYGVGELDKDDLTIDLLNSKDGSVKKTTAHFATSTYGTMKFPDGNEVAIARGKLLDETQPESWFGVWNLAFVNDTTGLGGSRIAYFNATLPATANGGGIAVDTSGRLGCEHQLKGQNAGQVICVQVNAQGAAEAAYLLTRSVHQADGLYGNTSTGKYHAFVTKILNISGTQLYLKEKKVPQASLPGLIEAAARSHWPN